MIEMIPLEMYPPTRTAQATPIISARASKQEMTTTTEGLLCGDEIGQRSTTLEGLIASITPHVQCRRQQKGGLKIKREAKAALTLTGLTVMLDE